MSCLHCGAETTNGLALCELCQRFAASTFDVLPVYFRNLARWTPGRAGSRDVPSSRVLWMGPVDNPDSTGDRITDALDEASNMLTTWARVLVDARPYLDRLLLRLSRAHLDEAQTVAWLCVGFNRYLISMATLDWCGEFVRDLAHHEERLRALTEQAAPGWYAGGCRLCGGSTYVVPGLTWLTCNNVIGYTAPPNPQPIICGATSHASDHLEVILDEARPWVARPKEIAATLVALLDGEQSVERLYGRIRKWESLGWIESQRRLDEEGDPIGPKMYALGDALDLALGQSDAPTRSMRMTPA